MFAHMFGLSVGVCNSGFGASGFTKVDTSREFAVDTKGLIKLMCQMGMRKLHAKGSDITLLLGRKREN